MVQNQELTKQTTVHESAYLAGSSLLLTCFTSSEDPYIIRLGKERNSKISDFFLLPFYHYATARGGTVQ